MDKETIIKPKELGGLGLILIEAQTIAIVGMTILWSTIEGEDTLQCILHVKLADPSEWKLGQRDYSWLFDTVKTKPIDESHLWSTFMDS